MLKQNSLSCLHQNKDKESNFLYLSLAAEVLHRVKGAGIYFHFVCCICCPNLRRDDVKFFYWTHSILSPFCVRIKDQ